MGLLALIQKPAAFLSIPFACIPAGAVHWRCIGEKAPTRCLSKA
jgi:hypothetical protein